MQTHSDYVLPLSDDIQQVIYSQSEILTKDYLENTWGSDETTNDNEPPLTCQNIETNQY